MTIIDSEIAKNVGYLDIWMIFVEFRGAPKNGGYYVISDGK